MVSSSEVVLLLQPAGLGVAKTNRSSFLLMGGGRIQTVGD